jgi:hypothetical protein
MRIDEEKFRQHLIQGEIKIATDMIYPETIKVIVSGFRFNNRTEREDAFAECSFCLAKMLSNPDSLIHHEHPMAKIMFSLDGTVRKTFVKYGLARKHKFVSLIIDSDGSEDRFMPTTTDPITQMEIDEALGELKMNDNEARILELHREGYNNEQISYVIGLTSARIGQILKELRLRYARLQLS